MAMVVMIVCDVNTGVTYPCQGPVLLFCVVSLRVE